MNGIRIGDDFGDGQLVAYRCNKNFSLVGSNTSYCVAGQWNSTKPICKGGLCYVDEWLSVLIVCIFSIPSLLTTISQGTTVLKVFIFSSFYSL